MAFSTTSYVATEVDGKSVEAKCTVSGAEEDGAIRLSINISGIPDKSDVFLEYAVRDQEDDMPVVELIPLGDPLTDFALCIAGRLTPAITITAYRCYKTSGSFRNMLSCLRAAAPALGIRAAWSALRCAGRVFGLL